MSITNTKKGDIFFLPQCDIASYSLLKWNILANSKTQYQNMLITMRSEAPDKFIALSMPTIEFMIQKNHFTFREVSDWWDYDTDHEKFRLFTSGSAMDLAKSGKLYYNDLDLLYNRNNYLGKLILSPDVLYLIREGIINFSQMDKLSLSSNVKITAIFNADTLFYIKSGLINFDRFEQFYDEFLYQFEPVVWKYFINAIAAGRLDYRQVMEQYANVPCTFQKYVMEQDFALIEEWLGQSSIKMTIIKTIVAH